MQDALRDTLRRAVLYHGRALEYATVTQVLPSLVVELQEGHESLEEDEALLLPRELRQEARALEEEDVVVVARMPDDRYVVLSLSSDTDAAGRVTDADLSAAIAAHSAAKVGVHGIPIMGAGQGLLWDGSNWVATDLVAATDARLTNARAPTGAAGGDLAGTYPNPTLAAAAKTLAANISAIESLASAAYADLATVGPSVTVPATATYLVRYGAYMRTNVASASALMAIQVGATAASDTDAAQIDCSTVSLGGSAVGAFTAALTSGTVLRAKYRATAGTGLWGRRWLAITRL